MSLAREPLVLCVFLDLKSLVFSMTGDYHYYYASNF